MPSRKHDPPSQPATEPPNPADPGPARAARLHEAAAVPEAAAGGSVLTMAIDTFRKRIEAVRGHVAAIAALLPGMVVLPAEDRPFNPGRFRSGETEGLYGVLTLAERFPQAFDVLADRDFGEDPRHFEAGVLRDRLARIDLLAAVSDALEGLAQQTSDTGLHLGEMTRPPLLLAYAIGKALAEHDVQARSDLAQALDYYGRSARRRAANRRVVAGGAPTPKPAK